MDRVANGMSEADRQSGSGGHSQAGARGVWNKLKGLFGGSKSSSTRDPAKGLSTPGTDPHQVKEALYESEETRRVMGR